jgi:lipoprotein-anchoring transpeptidase ErfK/SrfK
MRRQGGISKKIAVAALLGTISLTSAKVLADVRQAFSTRLPAAPSQKTDLLAAKTATSAKKTEPQKKQIQVSDNAEQLAEQQLSRLAPAKPSAALTMTPGPVRQIVISIPDRQLALLEDRAVVKIYPIAVGKPSTPSPAGDFTVINRATNPTYRHKGQVVAPGKANPVGTRWMGLSLKGYGIHGTNVQSSIGKAASHGCFRMKKKDVEELFALVRVGDAVSIRDERDELVARLFSEIPSVARDLYSQKDLQEQQ